MTRNSAGDFKRPTYKNDCVQQSESHLMLLQRIYLMQLISSDNKNSNRQNKVKTSKTTFNNDQPRSGKEKNLCSDP